MKIPRSIVIFCEQLVLCFFIFFLAADLYFCFKEKPRPVFFEKKEKEITLTVRGNCGKSIQPHLIALRLFPFRNTVARNLQRELDRISFFCSDVSLQDFQEFLLENDIPWWKKPVGDFLEITFQAGPQGSAFSLSQIFPGFQTRSLEEIVFLDFGATENFITQAPSEAFSARDFLRSYFGKEKDISASYSKNCVASITQIRFRKK